MSGWKPPPVRRLLSKNGWGSNASTLAVHGMLGQIGWGSTASIHTVDTTHYAGGRKKPIITPALPPSACPSVKVKFTPQPEAHPSTAASSGTPQQPAVPPSTTASSMPPGITPLWSDRIPGEGKPGVGTIAIGGVRLTFPASMPLWPVNECDERGPGNVPRWSNHGAGSPTSSILASSYGTRDVVFVPGKRVGGEVPPCYTIPSLSPPASTAASDGRPASKPSNPDDVHEHTFEAPLIAEAIYLCLPTHLSAYKLMTAAQRRFNAWHAREGHPRTRLEVCGFTNQIPMRPSMTILVPTSLQNTRERMHAKVSTHMRAATPST